MPDVATFKFSDRLKREHRLYLLLFLGVCLACGGPSAEEEAEHREKGFHCLSPWDGSHTALERLVKRRLKDPDSYEHVETRVSKKGADGLHSVYMTYRAKNSFGGFVVGTATGKYDAQCKVVSFSADG